MEEADSNFDDIVTEYNGSRSVSAEAAEVKT